MKDERGVEVVESLVLLHRLLEVLETVAGRPRRMEVHVGGYAVPLQLEEQPVEAVEQLGGDALRKILNESSEKMHVEINVMAEKVFSSMNRI